MANVEAGAVEPGQVIFYAECKPPLPAGDYALTLDQSVQVGAESHPLAPVRQTFRIEGPRFWIDPADVHSVSPPHQGDGPFDLRFPHIVLCRRTLPWERDPNGSTAGRSPWLALLVLTDEEYRAEGDGIEQSGNMMLRLLGTETNVTMPDPNILNLQKLVDEELVRSSAGTPLRSVRTLEISKRLFQSIAPCEQELSLLCHARQVSLHDKELLGLDQDGWFSVVVANRLPIRGQKHHVFLVSLEGHIANLPQLQGNTRYRAAPASADAGKIRLVVLHSWTFHCNALARDFESRMKHLSVGMLGASGAETEGGLVTLEFQTLEGEGTHAHYRGPLVPAPIEPDGHGTYFVADQARRLNRDSDIENLTYAAAFELGRLSALANPTFCVGLQRWRRAAAATLRAKAEEERQKALLHQYGTAVDVLLEGRSRESLTAALKSPQSVSRGIAEVGRNLVRQARAAGPQSTPYRWREAFGPVKLQAFDAKVRSSMQKTSGKSPQISAPPTGATVARQKVQRIDTSARQLKALTDASQTTVVETPPPSDPFSESVLPWLAQLRLLEGVPFAYLVPGESLLPPESIRFFYLDRNWTDSLIDGALSVGRSGSRELQHHLIHHGKALALSQEREATIRAARLEQRSKKRGSKSQKKQSTTSKPSTERTGFLLRSMAVRDWPGLEAVAFEDVEGKRRLELLRLERLAPDVMLCIYQGTPKRVELREPGECLQLGVDVGPIVKLKHIVAPSKVQADGSIATPGEIVSAPPVKVEMDPLAAKNVVNVSRLANALQVGLLKQGLSVGPELPTLGASEAVLLSSADLAVQLLQPPYVQPFEGDKDMRNLPEKALQYVFLLGNAGG